VPIREIVSQISPPMRILLAGAVVFLAVWFTLLRPKGSEDTSATTTTPAGNVNTGQPAQSEAGKIVQKAKTAVTEAEGAAKAAAGETTTDATKTAPGTATTTTPDAKADPVASIPAEQLAELPPDVAKAGVLATVMVLAVLADKGQHWRPMSDDDRYVRNTLKKVNRYDGDVFVKQVPLAKIDSYGVIVNDLKINQTPSIIVVDSKLKANVLDGYLDKVSINQAIADARRNSIEVRIKDPYVRQLNQTCANLELRLDRFNMPTTRAGVKPALRRFERLVANYRNGFASLKAPAKYRGVRNQVAGVVRDLESYGAALRSGNFARISTARTALLPPAAALNRKFGDIGAPTS